jgi:hypothetical protein
MKKEGAQSPWPYYNPTMEKELSYLSPEGYTVFTSAYLKNRGTCCKTACLHCPYGFTLKKLGLEFVQPGENDSELIEDIMDESGKEKQNWRAFTPENILFIKLKGVVAGVLFKNHIVVKHLFLRKHFQNQDLSREMVESYLFI